MLCLSQIKLAFLRNQILSPNGTEPCVLSVILWVCMCVCVTPWPVSPFINCHTASTHQPISFCRPIAIPLPQIIFASSKTTTAVQLLPGFLPRPGPLREYNHKPGHTTGDLSLFTHPFALFPRFPWMTRHSSRSLGKRHLSWWKGYYNWQSRTVLELVCSQQTSGLLVGL